MKSRSVSQFLWLLNGSLSERNVTYKNCLFLIPQCSRQYFRSRCRSFIYKNDQFCVFQSTELFNLVFCLNFISVLFYYHNFTAIQKVSCQIDRTLKISSRVISQIKYNSFYLSLFQNFNNRVIPFSLGFCCEL